MTVDDPAPGARPSLPQRLEDARVTSLPRSAFYIPNFITEAEEELILSKVQPPVPGRLSLGPR
ncbi:hypothetical protein IMZ48_46120 [Candidatus Bathyarchaeota archaeon]|nr:hypothetical protein [Candidatus Bathyarchaeota archaeon]